MSPRIYARTNANKQRLNGNGNRICSPAFWGDDLIIGLELTQVVEHQI